MKRIFTLTESNKKSLRLAIQGDPEAVAEAVRLADPIILSRLKYSMKGQFYHEIDEVAQLVRLRIVRKIHQLEAPEAFNSWVRTVAHTQALNFIQRHAQPFGLYEGYSEELQARILTCSRDEAAANERQDQITAVHDAIDVLGSWPREMLVRRYMRSQSYLEIAADLNIPIGTVKSRLSTARKHLKTVLEQTLTR